MSSDLRSNILKVLVSSAAPKSSAIIYKNLPMRDRPTRKELRTLLTDMAASGAVIMLAGNTPVFVAAPIESWARSMLLEQVSSGEKSEAKLKKALTKPHEHLFADAISVLMQEGKVFEHPSRTPKGKASYATTPVHLLKIIAKDLDGLVAMATMRGFSKAEIYDTVLRHLKPPTLVKIEEWNEPAPPLISSPEPRGNRALIVNGLALSILFLASLAFFGRHELRAMVQARVVPVTTALSVPVQPPYIAPPRAPILVEGPPQTYLPHPMAVPYVPPVAPPPASADAGAIAGVAATTDEGATTDEVAMPEPVGTADTAGIAEAVATSDALTQQRVLEVDEESLAAPGPDGLPVR